MPKRKSRPSGGKSKRQRTASVDAFIAENRNANTQATYSGGWRRFLTWAEEVENPLRRAGDAVSTTRPDEVDVASYMQYLATVKYLKIASITSAVAAISDHLRTSVSMDYPNPCAGERVRRMKAVLTPITQPPTQKKEITWTQLMAIHTACEKDGSALARRDSCMFMLAYFAYLRVSEIARMNREDITFTSETVGTNEITIMRVHVDRMAKNDSERKGHERLVGGRGKDEFCPVRQMKAHLDSETSGGMALFTTARGMHMSTNTPQFSLKRWLTATGVEDPERYGFHSMRAGAATDTARAGVDERHIKSHGNWKSDAVKLYVRESIGERLTASGALGRM